MSYPRAMLYPEAQDPQKSVYRLLPFHHLDLAEMSQCLIVPVAPVLVLEFASIRDARLHDSDRDSSST